MLLRFIRSSILAMAAALPAVAMADESAVPDAEHYYSGLRDRSLLGDKTNQIQHRLVKPGQSADAAGDAIAESSSLDDQGGSAGGYMIFGSPATTTFLAPGPARDDESFLDGVEFGVDWRADVSSAQDHDYRRLSRSFSGVGIDKVGVRADLTALLRDEFGDESTSTVWRVTGMLGSTSLSLLSGDELSSDAEGGGLLWDIGVAWSSGAISVNAGYQSTFGLDDSAGDDFALAVLSLGADYAIMPGLSVYGEFNLIDGPWDENQESRDTMIILGTGVNF